MEGPLVGGAGWLAGGGVFAGVEVGEVDVLLFPAGGAWLAGGDGVELEEGGFEAGGGAFCPPPCAGGMPSGRPSGASPAGERQSISPEAELAAK